MADSLRVEALRLAEQYVTKDRNARHGDPEDNFETILRMCQAFSDARGWETAWTRADVAMFCIFIKSGRAANDPSYLDNYVDIIGYAACAYEVAANATRRGERIDAEVDDLDRVAESPPVWVPGQVIEIQDPNPLTEEQIEEALNAPPLFAHRTTYPYWISPPDEDPDTTFSGKESGT